MKKNMGKADRTIRIILALVVGFLILNGTLSGLVATVLGIFAIVFLLTSAAGICLLYIPFKISTMKK